MSTTVDSRVVEMRFDNQNFERNVSHTMSTLEKLKQKLNLTGASKGLENINSAAKNVNMTGLGSAVETVSAKFSALQVMGVTALANITNSAVNAGKRMVSALTIDPIKTGFQEYETQINATQTILANTASKGSTIKDVNKALAELNTYADKTIYNFTEMTRNIGTFTAAGIDLDTSVNAIQGIANLAAVSGSTSQQASTAMYQLSQALAAGTVKLMDWNSVVNAGMGGEMFQKALRETSELLGTGAEAAIKARGSFRESLRDGWITSEVLTETLKKFTTSGANEYIAEYTGLTQEAVAAELELATQTYGEAEAIEYASKALAKKSGKNAEEIKQALQFAKNAEDAATKVKTFSQLWDVMKESAQSGWSQTWKLIVGDFEQAKNLLTPLADFLTGAINKFSEARNKVLESALGKSFENIGEAVKSITKPIEKSAEGIGEVVDTVKDYATIVDEIIGGGWGNGQERWDKLAEAGYDWAHAQNLVNEKLGSSVRHTTDYKEAQEGVVKTQEEITEANAEYIEELAAKSKEELKEMGLKEHQIMALKTLQHQSEKTGIPVRELAKDIDLLNGRTLLMNGFKNVGMAIVNVFKSMKTAWQDIFPPKSTEEKARAVYDLIAAFHKFTTHLNLIDAETGEFTETGEKLVRIFKGIFAIVDVLATILGGGLRIAFKLLSAVLEYFGMDILDLLAYVGDAAVKFRDWFDGLVDFSGIVEKVIPLLSKGVTAVRGWISAFLNLPIVQSAIEKIKNVFSSLGSFELGDLSGIKNMVSKAFEAIKDIDLTDAGEYLWDGLILGLGDGARKIINKIVEVCTNLYNSFCEFFGIHSPSTVFMTLGGFLIAGLILGIEEGLVAVPESLQGILDKCKEFFQNVDWGAVVAIGTVIGGLLIVNKVADAIEAIAGPLEAIASPFEAIGTVLESTAGLIDEFSGVAKAMAFEVKTEGVKNLAIALAILAGSVLLLAHFGKDNWGDIVKAAGILTWLSALLIVMAIALNKLSQSSVSWTSGGGLQINGIVTSLISIAAAIGILALSVKLLGGMEAKELGKGFLTLIGIMGALLGFIFVCQLVTKNGVAGDIVKLSTLMITMSIAMGLMIAVCKLAGKLSEDDMKKGGAFAVAFLAFTALMAGVARTGGAHASKIGTMMIKMALAIGLMVLVCKLISKLDPVEAVAGGVFALAFAGFVALLVKATSIAGNRQIAKLGTMLLSVTLAMMLMVGVCKLVGMLSSDEMIRGAMFAGVFAAFVAILVAVTEIGDDKKIAKVAGTIIAISAAIAILSIVSILLGMVSTENLVKGILAVSILSIMMAIMIRSLKGAQNVKGALIVMAVAIGVLAAAVAGLSFIKPERLVVATAAMSALMGMFTLMMKTSKNVKKHFGALIVMTTAIAVMAGALILLSMLKVENALVNAGALSLLMLAMSGVFFILSKIRVQAKDAAKNIAFLTAMAIPLLAFALVLKQLNGVDVSTKNVLLLIGLMAAMTGLLAILSIVGNGVMGCIVGILALTAMWVPMMAFIDILKRLKDITVVKENVLALVGLMAAMTVLLAILTIVGFGALSAVLGVLALTAMWVPMVVFIDVLKRVSSIDVAKENVLVLIGLMAAMTGLLAVLAIVGFLAIPAVLGVLALTAMWIPMVAFIDIIKKVSDVDMAVENVMMLMSMMGILTGLLTQLAMIGPMAVIGVAALTGLVALMGVLAVMAMTLGGLVTMFPTLQTFMDTGIELLVNLAGGIGRMIGAFVSNILTEITGSLPQIGTDLSNFMINALPFITLAKLVDEKVVLGVGYLAAAIIALTVADLIAGLTELLPMGTSFAELGTNLSTFMINALPFVMLSKLVDSAAVEAAAKLAEIILILSAADLVSGIVGFITGTGGVDFTSMGEQLGEFAKAVCGFSNAINENGGIDPTAIDAAVKAGLLIVELEKSLPKKGGWVQNILGETDLGTFAVSCIAFGNAMIDISNAITEGGGIKTGAIKSMAKAGESLAELENSLPRKGGWIQEVCGAQELATFGASCVAFGQAMCDFSSIVEFKGGINKEHAEDAKAAGEIMLALQDALPKSGGFIQEIAGEEDLADFGRSCVAFGDALTTFSTSTIIDENAVTKATNAGKMMAELQKAIPEEKWFDGKMSLDDFGKKIVKFGEKLAEYSESIADMDTSKITTSITQANRIATLIKNIADLDTSGISKFKIKELGTAIKSYANQVKDIDAAVVASSISSAKKLVGLINSLVSLDTSGISKFKLKELGFAIKLYNKQVRDIDTNVVSNSISAARKMVSLINSMAGINTSGVNSFKSAVDTLGTVSLNSVVKAFKGSAVKMVSAGTNLVDSIVKGVKSKQGSLNNATNNMITTMVKNIKSKASVFNSTGKTLIARFILGINSQRSQVSSIITKTLSSAVSSARGYYTKFYKAGSYLVSGFANGISENSYKAAAKARAMAQAAYEAAKDELDINSPSKIFRALAYSVPEGFAMGIDRGASVVRNSAVGMSDTAIDSVKNSISRIYDVVHNGIETQPTIRPVLDLSDVKSGANSIASMLGKGSYLGVSANIDAVSGMMARRNQNGANSDVVSAIDKLRKDLGNVGNTTYNNINGITYDDGSNIANAVETLTRAARIERRI